MITLYLVYKHQIEELRSDGTERESADGNGSIYFFGRGSQDDSIETLLKRISWSAYLFRRTSNWERVFIMTVIATFLLTLITSYQNGKWKMPSAPTMIITGVIIFFVVFFTEGFLFVHGDVYSAYYIRQNAHLLAGKLNLPIDFSRDPPNPTTGPPDRINVMI